MVLAIQTHPTICGFNTGGLEHRIALFADDNIEFLLGLRKSIPFLLELMSEYGGFSGFKVNSEKSSIMFLNDRWRINIVIPHPFMNAVDGFNYLGIKITPKISDVSSTNYKPLLASVSEDITRWMALPLSLIVE